ncbi:hypothetical protein Q8A67_006326 [Cirrhinus molitorella]|uniref:Uncharacterized protein n=1 Tax=Cirrhinus molitorella TaxID=172907 RepID=A0AA88Q1W1_9TELE|nr:hypothetical protein Q8A67_006326 [Cirrhinus molitorella]
MTIGCAAEVRGADWLSNTAIQRNERPIFQNSPKVASLQHCVNMPRKGRRSQAQKLRWTKVDLRGQTSISKGVAQVYDRQQSEDGDNTSRILSVQASHSQSDASCRKSLETIAVLSKTGCDSAIYHPKLSV